MLAPAPAASPDRPSHHAPPPAPLHAPSHHAPDAAHAPPDVRRCRYCCADVAREAKKCRACGEWLVGTTPGLTAGLLRVVGWLWVALSCGAAAALWYVGSFLRMQLLLRALDPAISPLLLDVALYVSVALVLLQGFAIGLGLGVLAGLAPRRPHWWA